jgi:hypothetical protein
VVRHLRPQLRPVSRFRAAIPVIRTAATSLCLVLALIATGCGLFDALPTVPSGETAAPAPGPTPTPTPTPAPTPTLPPPPPIAIVVADAQIESQGTSTATVTLATAAPADGAVVLITSSEPTLARMPSSVTIAGGSTSASFRIETVTVSMSTPITVSVRYQELANASTFNLTPPRLVGSFTVSSTRRGSNLCEVIEGGDNIDCRVNARGSRGFVSRYYWTFSVQGSDEWGQVNADPEADIEEFSCDFILGLRPNRDSNGETYLQLLINLQLRDPNGDFGGEVERAIRLYPGSLCGF